MCSSGRIRSKAYLSSNSLTKMQWLYPYAYLANGVAEFDGSLIQYKSALPESSESNERFETFGDRLPYKFYVLGQIGLSKQCRPRSDCF